MTPVLSVHNLNKRFGSVVAANDISIDVGAGERLCLIGANGAGKTSFVNMVTGYLTPNSGRILYRGQDITRLGPREVANIGMCRSFQIPLLCAELTAFENMLVALAAARPRPACWRSARAARPAAAAHAALARFAIGDHADRAVSTLPGGVRKLLDIAMATVRDPGLLMLDEPTSGVAGDHKFETMDRVMEAMSGQDTTVIFVEHDMEIVARYATRVAAFYEGRIIADGPPAEVLAAGDVRRHVTGGKA